MGTAEGTVRELCGTFHRQLIVTMLARQSLRLAPQLVSAAAVRGNAAMAFTFASQGEVFYNKAEVRQVDVPSFSGSFGILPQHVPSLAVLKPGVVTVFPTEGDARKIFVSSGTVTINEDSSVQLLAEEAVDVSKLDVAEAKAVLAASHSAASTARTEAEKAEAMIAVEVAEELVKASE